MADMAFAYLFCGISGVSMQKRDRCSYFNPLARKELAGWWSDRCNEAKYAIYLAFVVEGSACTARRGGTGRVPTENEPAYVRQELRDVEYTEINRRNVTPYYQGTEIHGSAQGANVKDTVDESESAASVMATKNGISQWKNSFWTWYLSAYNTDWTEKK